MSDRQNGEPRRVYTHALVCPHCNRRLKADNAAVRLSGQIVRVWTYCPDCLTRVQVTMTRQKTAEYVRTIVPLSLECGYCGRHDQVRYDDVGLTPTTSLWVTTICELCRQVDAFYLEPPWRLAGDKWWERQEADGNAPVT